MSRFDDLFRHELDQRAAKGRRRRLRPLVPLDAGRVRLGGRELIDLSSNDYLGLSRHPALIERARDWAAQYGAGSGASRLVRGSFELHDQVEAKVAALKGTEAALLFATGWQLNAAVVPALIKAAKPEGPPVVFTDRLIHASLHHGCRAAGVRYIPFRHNDLEHLDALLEARADQPGRRFILTESVFSMDGDCADIARLADLAQRHEAFLYLDEAHATGVLGPKGAGLAALAPGRIDLVMGTFSKALGGFGAYVAGSQTLIDYLVNACSGLVYTTAPPPPVLGAMDAALDLIPAMDAERAHLQALAAQLRSGLRRLGVDTLQSTTQIVPAVVGGELEAVELSRQLEAGGVLAVAIRPPTVPNGESRLRLALGAAHREADVARVLELMAAHWPARQTAA